LSCSYINPYKLTTLDLEGLRSHGLPTNSQLLIPPRLGGVKSDDITSGGTLEESATIIDTANEPGLKLGGSLRTLWLLLGLSLVAVALGT
jgi:hypothetical protein